MRLLVTGVSGLLGVNLAWLAAGRFDVVGVMRGERAEPVPGKAPFQTIIADLTQAINTLPESSDRGRVNKFAALTLLGKVYLTRATIEKYRNATGDGRAGA